MGRDFGPCHLPRRDFNFTPKQIDAQYSFQRPFQREPVVERFDKLELLRRIVASQAQLLRQARRAPRLFKALLVGTIQQVDTMGARSSRRWV